MRRRIEVDDVGGGLDEVRQRRPRRVELLPTLPHTAAVCAATPSPPPTCPATYTVFTPFAVTATAPWKPFDGLNRSIVRSVPGSATTAIASISTRSGSANSSRTPIIVLAGQCGSGKVASRTSAISGYCAGSKSFTKMRTFTTSAGVAPACSSRRTTPANADSTCSRSVSPCPTCPDTKTVLTPSCVDVTTCVKPPMGSMYSTCAAAAPGIRAASRAARESLVLYAMFCSPSGRAFIARAGPTG